MSCHIKSLFPDLSKELFQKHEFYKEKSLTKRRFKHQDIVPIVENLPFEVETIGFSFENRAIYQVKIGSGKTKVLLWSQMHGDEATATMAMMDIFRFFEEKNDEFIALKAKILEECTLYFVPMLNPDGAERFQRRTALDIDMNRDALRFVTPEAQLLKKLQDELKPEFSFNLHDQGIRYSAGMSEKQATISFLATSYNFPQDWNEARTKAMQVIVGMSECMGQFIPGHIGKWNDAHEPRAFGDNIALWGSSLILIESGGYKDDVEKQTIRRLNFVAILNGLQAIAEKTYLQFQLEAYENIPNNEKFLFDFLIRNATFVHGEKSIRKDIGINLSEKNINNATDFILSSTVEDLGDLSTFWGIKEIDATDLEVKPLADFPALIEKYGLTEQYLANKEVILDEPANFVLAKNNEPIYVIVNGQIV